MSDLHNQTLALVLEERRLTGQIIANLQKIQDTNLHLSMGYSSLFEYCTKALGYAESCAYRRISAVKVVRQLPEITQHLDAGTLTLTNVAMAQTFFANAHRQHQSLNIETKKEILQALANCSKRQTEEILIQSATKLGLSTTGLEITEKVRPLTADTSLLQVRLNKETLDKLNRLKNLRSHKNPNMSYSDLIDDLCTLALKKFDPQTSKSTSTASTDNITPPNTQTPSRYIPLSLRRTIWQRDQGQCTYTTTDNTRCRSNHLLQIDHIKPVYLGGETTHQNLRLLCHAHHKLRHKEI